MRYSRPIHTCPEAHTTSCTIGTGSPSVGYSGRGVVVLTFHDLLSPRGVECEYEYTYPCFPCVLALHAEAQHLHFYMNKVNNFIVHFLIRLVDFEGEEANA